MLSFVLLAVLLQPSVALFSRLFFVDEIDSPTKTEYFHVGCFIYVASSFSKEANEMEKEIYISANEIIKSISSAANLTSQERFLKPVFRAPTRLLTLSRSNPHIRYRNPAIIYVVEAEINSRLMLSPKEISSVALSEDERFLTILAPLGLVRLNDFSGFSIFAGGAAETEKEEYKLHDKRHLLRKGNPPLLIFEPLVSIRRSSSNGSPVTLNVSGKEEWKTRVEMDVDWEDSVVAMASGYRLFNHSSPMSFLFKAKRNNTVFAVNLSGDIPSTSEITFHTEKHGGIGSESINGMTNLKDVEFEFVGNHLGIDYGRSKEDHSWGFFAKIQIKKAAASFSSFFTLVVLFSF